MNLWGWCSAQAWMAQDSVCVCETRLGLDALLQLMVLDVSCVTSSDIDSFSHQEAGGWGWCLLTSSPAQHSHDHSQHT